MQSTMRKARKKERALRLKAACESSERGAVLLELLEDVDASEALLLLRGSDMAGAVLVAVQVAIAGEKAGPLAGSRTEEERQCGTRVRDGGRARKGGCRRRCSKRRAAEDLG